MRYSLHPDAELELAAAAHRYLIEAGVVVAEEFLVEFERIMQVLQANPAMGATASGGRRRFPFRRFPYSVVYRVSDNVLRVLVVAHQHRHPSYGRGRSL